MAGTVLLEIVRALFSEISWVYQTLFKALVITEALAILFVVVDSLELLHNIINPRWTKSQTCSNSGPSISMLIIALWGKGFWEVLLSIDITWVLFNFLAVGDTEQS